MKGHTKAVRPIVAVNSSPCRRLVLLHGIATRPAILVAFLDIALETPSSRQHRVRALDGRQGLSSFARLCVALFLSSQSTPQPSEAAVGRHDQRSRPGCMSETPAGKWGTGSTSKRDARSLQHAFAWRHPWTSRHSERLACGTHHSTRGVHIS